MYFKTDKDKLKVNLKLLIFITEWVRAAVTAAVRMECVNLPMQAR